METGKIICDTDVLIDLFDSKKERHQQTLFYIGEFGGNGILASAVTEMEIIKGVRNREHEQQVRKSLRRVYSIPIDPSMSGRAISLLNTYHLGYGLEITDALVAATAIEMDMPLFTYNVRDFRFIRELRLYVP